MFVLFIRLILLVYCLFYALFLFIINMLCLSVAGSTITFYRRQFHQYFGLETLIHKYRLANQLF